MYSNLHINYIYCNLNKFTSSSVTFFCGFLSIFYRDNHVDRKVEFYFLSNLCAFLSCFLDYYTLKDFQYSCEQKW